MATRRAGTKGAIFQVKVTLNEIRPAIWRRLLVPASIRLPDLHDVIQAAMGWTNCHLHSFEIADHRFGDPSIIEDMGELSMEDERRMTLAKVIGPGDALAYAYDFGDDWQHEVAIEAVLKRDSRLTYPLCIDGARACPPEDCGGAPGYDNLLTILRDDTHEEHDDTLRWVGGLFDPEGFDLNRTNRAIWIPGLR